MSLPEVKTWAEEILKQREESQVRPAIRYEED